MNELSVEILPHSPLLRLGKHGSSLLNGCASKVPKKWLQRINNVFVSNSIAGDHAVTILQIRIVIGQRLSKEISKFAAGFVKNDFGSTGVPLFCAR